MKSQFFIILLLVATANPLFSRENILINLDWKFKLGDHPGAMSVDYDDSNWQKVDLPHDASIYGEFVRDTLGGTSRNGFRPRHIGWYRKHIKLDNNINCKKIYIEFEGVYRASDVWVNGKHCGTFLNGYLDFQYDISGMVSPGENVITVRYDNTFNESSRWYTGEGINRDVYLHILDPVHVNRYGTFITTPRISKESAKVVIETEVINTNRDSVQCRLVTDIVSPEGEVVATRTSVVPFAGGEKFNFHQEFKAKDPVLWDIENPVLYEAVSKVYNGEKLEDVYKTSFGIREVEFTPEEGFLLNGRKVFLKGVCLHHDLGSLGAASFERGWEKRLSVLKDELGCNAIRLSHNPYPNTYLTGATKTEYLFLMKPMTNGTNSITGQGTALWIIGKKI